ncbi:MAG: hypothetical protein CL931_17620 [Deltaproteobacteria bacterium]|nr:hypothetical protein [Deltaproteobacteria bacterium]
MRNAQLTFKGRSEEFRWIPEAGRFPPDKLSTQIIHVHPDDLKRELRDFNKTRCRGSGVAI